MVWNATRQCNLDCAHCPSDSRGQEYAGELSTAEAQAMIEDLGRFGVPVLRFSGGEPLLRPDLVELVALAHRHGIRPELSTNGTLLTPTLAARLRRAGLAFVAISLEGVGPANDRWCGQEGAFDSALAAFRHCREAGQRVGLRLTLTKKNHRQLEAIFELIEREKIPRACFYHLVYAGRGSSRLTDDLSHEETRRAMDLILRRARDFHRRGLNVEVLTADNHVDGIYLYLKLTRENPLWAAEVYRRLKSDNGGLQGSGLGIGNIDSQGNVHPDPFWQHYTLGNIRQKPFSQVWADVSDPLMAGLRDRLPMLKGRCANCLRKEVCGGGSRVRAEKVYGDPWMDDPACYLSSQEVSQPAPSTREAVEDDVLIEEQAA